MLLKIFQYITIGVVILLSWRFKTFDDRSSWKVNRVVLITSGILLTGMIIYELANYECMSSGIYGVPVELQLIALVLTVYFWWQNKE